MKTVFFYGLFMDECLLKAKGFNPIHIESVSLMGFQLKIGERATLVQKSGGVCYGVVMDMTGDELKQLYSGEGVEDYQAEEVVVQTGEGRAVNAITYLLPESMLEGSNSDYALKLAEVAAKIKLPAEYIEEIKTWISF